MRICITVMYDGTDYCGWQLQPNQRSIQGELTEAIKSLTGESVTLRASGRTDAGVHALGQRADFKLLRKFDPSKLVKGLNFYLPQSIRVINAVQKPEDFNARFDAKRKTYIFKMYISKHDNPLMLNRALRLDEGIDVLAMKGAAKVFEGTHDFMGFMSSGSDIKTTIRTVYSCRLSKRGSELTLSICANGFLYNMVRRIVASLILAGQGKLALQDIQRALLEGEQQNGIAPPYGLYLLRVTY